VITMDEDPMVPVSISIPLSLKRWIKANTMLNFSEFCRGALEHEIERQSGYTRAIELMEAEILRDENHLEEKKARLNALRGKQVEFEAEKVFENVKDLLIRAILRIPYDSWGDAAGDLESERGELSEAEWKSLVEDTWREIHGDA